MLRRAVTMLLAVALCGCTAPEDSEAEVRSAVADYLTAWSTGAYGEAARLTDDPAATEDLLSRAATWLGVPGPDGRLADVTVTDAAATADVDLVWTPPGSPEWRYRLGLDLRQDTDGDWRLRSGPDTVHPSLRAGQELQLTRSLPPRASILAEDGTPLFAETPIVDVGVDPGAVTDIDALAATLAQVLDVDAAQVASDVRAGTAGQFVPVITLRRSDYDAVRDEIHDLPGTVFREDSRQLAPTAQFARGVLGRVGAVTAEVIAESAGLLAPGDEGGLAGLQRTYQRQLTGTPGLTVATVAAGQVAEQLADIAAQPGRPLPTTLSVAVETAADQAVQTQRAPAYLVVVRPSTGAILAVATNDAATPANALIGQYPAGSTFKIITAAAILGAGLAAPTTTVACPASTTVEGREFENQDRFDLGDVPFTTAFARSCNSTFTALGVQLPPAALPEAAAQFGIGSDWSLPVDTMTGSVPVPDTPVVQAADSIGQGDVLVSPVAMALVAATVVAGSVPVPVLVPTEDPAGTSPPGPSSPVVDALRSMTRAVVTEGTASALADLPGGVGGKTGTAEFGTGDPPPAHAWFAGYRGDLAFAAFVEGGQSSATTAVPMAETFLEQLPS